MVRARMHSCIPTTSTINPGPEMKKGMRCKKLLWLLWCLWWNLFFCQFVEEKRMEIACTWVCVYVVCTDKPEDLSFCWPCPSKRIKDRRDRERDRERVMIFPLLDWLGFFGFSLLLSLFLLLLLLFAVIKKEEKGRLCKILIFELCSFSPALSR